MFKTAYASYPTMEDLIGATIQTEYWANRAVIDTTTNRTIGEVVPEGLSREYFAAQNCNHGVCTTINKLANFLSGYQDWTFGVTCNNVNDCASLIKSAYNNALSSGALSSASSIFNPQPSDPTGQNINADWATQGQCNRPWQWFNQDTSSSRTIGTNKNQVYDRFELSPVFEVYTLGQTDNLNGIADNC